MEEASETGSDDPKLKLRTGLSVWELGLPRVFEPTPAPCPQKADILIVGAGITGSFLAERLTRMGRNVLVLDRHRPHTASTAASTALLQWEIDAPMLELEAQLGYEKASFIYRRSYDAVRTIANLVSALRIEADFHPRRTLYLAGNKLDGAALAEEHRLREKAGLGGTLLDRDAVRTEFGFDRAAAILSDGSAEADPIALAKALLNIAIQRGAQVCFPITVTDYAFGSDLAHVSTDQGLEIEAKTVIMANGYEMPGFVPSTRHRLASTWALATVPQLPSLLWPQRALIWEASEPYAYLRTTVDHRIIIGGEDENITDERVRDAKIPLKVAALLQKLATFAPGANATADTAWAGFFGETDDGLPLIGTIPSAPNCYAAFGYGGNGITFSAIAADLIAGLIAGERDPLCDLFSVDR